MGESRPRSFDALIAAAGLGPPPRACRWSPSPASASVAFDPSLPLILLSDTTGPRRALPGRHAASRAPRGPRSPLSAATTCSGACRTRAGRTSSRVDEAALPGRRLARPALDPIENLASPHGIAAISARLRAPDGCPWDRRQTHLTLRPYLLEEAYETIDAIENGTTADLRRGAWRPLPPGRPPRPVRGGGGRLRPD